MHEKRYLIPKTLSCTFRYLLLKGVFLSKEVNTLDQSQIQAISLNITNTTSWWSELSYLERKILLNHMFEKEVKLQKKKNGVQVSILYSLAKKWL